MRVAQCVRMFTDREMRATIELDGRPIYETTFGTEPVKSMYDGGILVHIEAGFTDNHAWLSSAPVVGGGK